MKGETNFGNKAVRTFLEILNGLDQCLQVGLFLSVSLNFMWDTLLHCVVDYMGIQDTSTDRSVVLTHRSTIGLILLAGGVDQTGASDVDITEHLYVMSQFFCLQYHLPALALESRSFRQTGDVSCHWMSNLSRLQVVLIACFSSVRNADKHICVFPQCQNLPDDNK